jgi:hypothetical protein
MIIMQIRAKGIIVFTTFSIMTNGAAGVQFIASIKAQAKALKHSAIKIL